MHKFATFTAGQAAQITGVPADLQRDWRRRGILASVEGHARYTPSCLCRLMVLKELNKLQLRNSVSEEELEKLSGTVLFHALSYLRSYAGNVDRYMPDISTLWMAKLRFTGISQSTAIDIWKAWPLRDRIMSDFPHLKSDHVALGLNGRFVSSAFYSDDFDEDMKNGSRFGFSVPVLRLNAMGVHLSRNAPPYCFIDLDAHELTNDPLSNLHDLDELFRKAHEEYEKLSESSEEWYGYEINSVPVG